MVRVIFLFVYLFLSNMAFGQWNINTIPESLLKNANVVIRRHAADVKCVKVDKIVVAENLVFTIFEESESTRFAFHSIIGPFLNDEMLDVRVYDDNGKRIRGLSIRLDKSDNLKSDYKICIIGATNNTKFPLTIELEYKKALKGFGDIQSWNPIINYNVSLQSASLRLTVIDSSFVKYSSGKLSTPDRFINEDGNCVYIWEANDFPAIAKGSPQELPLNALPYVKVENIENL